MMLENRTGYPSRSEAAALLEWGYRQNPGPWRDHSVNAAKAAQTIARACGMDAQKAYVLGLLHDIGRYEGARALHHTIVGYQLLMEKGYPDAARIAMTHSFPSGGMETYIGEMDTDEAETQLIRGYIADAEYDDYDRLIQLCDAMSLPEGICPVEYRLVDVALRHGVFEFTLEKWKVILGLKTHFDALAGANIYAFLRQEITNTIFG